MLCSLQAGSHAERNLPTPGALPILVPVYSEINLGLLMAYISSCHWPVSKVGLPSKRAHLSLSHCQGTHHVLEALNPYDLHCGVCLFVGLRETYVLLKHLRMFAHITQA